MDFGDEGDPWADAAIAADRTTTGANTSSTDGGGGDAAEKPPPAPSAVVGESGGGGDVDLLLVDVGGGAPEPLTGAGVFDSGTAATAAAAQTATAAPLNDPSAICDSTPSLAFVDAASTHSAAASESLSPELNPTTANNPAIEPLALEPAAAAEELAAGSPLIAAGSPAPHLDASVPPSEPTSSLAIAAAGNLDDDFGDFGDFEMTAPPPPSAEQVAATTEPVPAVVHAVGVPGAFDDAVDDQEEDDFGDFGAETIPTATLPPTAVEDVSPNAVKLPASRGRGESDAGDEARVEKLVDTIGSDLDPAARTAFDLFGAALRDSISLCPVASEAAMATVTPMVRDEVEAPTTDGATAAGADSARASFKGRITLPNDAFSNTDWYNVWKHLSSEQSYTENVQSKFRWKRSHIRQMYLKALNVAAPDDASSPENSSAPKDGRIDVVAQPATSTSTEKSRETGEAAAVFHSQSGADAKDTRQAEIDEAKSYCNISEEELRKQTNEELVGLIKVLAMHQVKMQEQANFWLDAKEQLLMDAEMHNKMIASLVQYATQQHVGSPKGAPRSPQKHKKRTVGRPH